ncbi:MAG: substrate-binding domain-containing protein [Symbiopectobacterium sp.]
MRVPDDMSLVGMDNILPLDMLPVSLTTVHMPLDAVARATLQLLTQQLVLAQSLGVT